MCLNKIILLYTLHFFCCKSQEAQSRYYFMQLLKSIGFLVLFTVILISCKEEVVKISSPYTSEELDERLHFLSAKMNNHLTALTVDSLQIPRSTDENGELIATVSRSWTSGFFPGTLWQLYDHSKNERLRESAMTWTSFVEKEKWDTHTHDLGFKVNNSFGHAYKITKEPKYKDVVVQTSKTLIKRYNPKIQSIRSWDFNADIWQFPVIIDNLMNLEMLYDATEFTGDSTYYNIATQHAETTLKNHFRPDHSSYHVIDYDTITASVRLRNTHQGTSDDSAWVRGQAWGLYGFTHCYKRTRIKAFLDQAIEIAEFIMTHPNLPTNNIPYWDFDAPNIPNEPRDVSAAMVTASALIDLSAYDTANKEKYIQWVDKALRTLEMEEYQTDINPFLLDHSTGSVPGNFEIDVPIVYGDYYYIEALTKRLKHEDQNK